MNPVYEFLGADPSELPILNLAGPITGLLIQPLIGAISDRTWSPRWGRRKPFFLIGAIGCSICLFLFPFVTAVWMAVCCCGCSTPATTRRWSPTARSSPTSCRHPSWARASWPSRFFTGLGITLANISLFVFQKFIAGATEAGIPYWVVGSFMLGAVCSIGTVLVSVLDHTGDPAERRGTRGAAGQEGRPRPGAARRSARRSATCRPQFRKLALVYLFQWYGMVCYWQFVALSIAKSVFPPTPRRARRRPSRGPAWSTAGTTS